MKKAPFKLNGRPLVSVPAPVLKIKALLEKLPDNELITKKELVEGLGWCGGTLESNDYRMHELLEPFKQLVRYPQRQMVYGNKKTIAELRKHKELIA